MREAKWFEVTYQEQQEKPEPEWDKIPEAKRGIVRTAWEARPWETRTERWYGPQIDFMAGMFGRKLVSVGVSDG